MVTGMYGAVEAVAAVLDGLRRARTAGEIADGLTPDMVESYGDAQRHSFESYGRGVHVFAAGAEIDSPMLSAGPSGLATITAAVVDSDEETSALGADAAVEMIAAASGMTLLGVESDDVGFALSVQVAVEW